MRLQQIITAIERMGFQVVKARRLEDAEIAVAKTDHGGRLGQERS